MVQRSIITERHEQNAEFVGLFEPLLGSAVDHYTGFYFPELLLEIFVTLPPHEPAIIQRLPFILMTHLPQHLSGWRRHKP